jgi:hypothetical protein
MHYSFLLLGCSALAVFADRGSAPNIAPTVCTGPETVTVIVTPVPVTALKQRAEPTYTGVVDRRRAQRLSKRQGTVSYSNCETEFDPDNSWYKAGLRTKQAVLEQAHIDAVTMAKAAKDVAADNAGFTHYFGGTAADKQLSHFKDMMKAVASDTNYYSIQFECKDTPSCADTSVMVTDATTGEAGDVKKIEVCPKFWTSPGTKYVLPRSSTTEPSPPYRAIDRTSTGWCQQNTGNGKDVSRRAQRYFITAGATVLHELTHLDSLAKEAGLEAEEGRHGTADPQSGCEFPGARSFLKSYIAGQTDDTSPDYNAESYAAAASEIYFMGVCDFAEIRPLVTV